MVPICPPRVWDGLYLLDFDVSAAGGPRQEGAQGDRIGGFGALKNAKSQILRSLLELIAYKVIDDAELIEPLSGR